MLGLHFLLDRTAARPGVLKLLALAPPMREFPLLPPCGRLPLSRLGRFRDDLIVAGLRIGHRFFYCVQEFDVNPFLFLSTTLEPFEQRPLRNTG